MKIFWGILIGAGAVMILGAPTKALAWNLLVWAFSRDQRILESRPETTIHVNGSDHAN